MSRVSGARRLSLACAAALALATTAIRAEAYCPSYTASSPNNDAGCAIEAANGQNPSVPEWNAIFDLVSQGPAAWGDAGPTVTDIGQGCGKPEPLVSVPARFPCELLKGIAMQESGWRQFCVPDTPADQVGGPERTIISFDCGYGIGQVTSGMHFGESPDFDREKVASDPTYNLATGTRILAEKWKITNCVGDNQPTIVEDWYSATWAYNGLAYVNNPSNPNYDPNRGVWDPNVGGGAPYQEKVFGWIENNGGQWDAVALAYPNPGDVGGTGQPLELPEPSCASPTDCGNTRPTHVTACDGRQGTGGAGPGAGGGEPTSGNASGAGGGATGGGGSIGAGDTGAGPSGSGGDDGPKSDGPPGADADGGCACRAAGTGPLPAGAGPIGAIAALAIALRRRRR